LNNILNQTLEHERLSTSKIILDEDSVDLHEVVKSTAAMWKKPCIDKGLKLDIRVSADMPKSIMIDSSRLRQCLTNLMSNAVKFTKSGSIVIAVAPMNLETDTPRVLLAVRDTGIGMSPEATENMFKPYQQANTTIHRRFGAEIRKNVAIVPSDYSGFDVLIVEDNPINQAVVKKLLNNHAIKP